MNYRLSENADSVRDHAMPHRYLLAAQIGQLYWKKGRQGWKMEDETNKETSIHPPATYPEQDHGFGFYFLKWLS